MRSSGVSLLHEDLGIMALAGGALIILGALYFSSSTKRVGSYAGLTKRIAHIRLILN